MKNGGDAEGKILSEGKNGISVAIQRQGYGGVLALHRKGEPIPLGEPLNRLQALGRRRVQQQNARWACQSPKKRRIGVAGHRNAVSLHGAGAVWKWKNGDPVQGIGGVICYGDPAPVFAIYVTRHRLAAAVSLDAEREALMQVGKILCGTGHAGDQRLKKNRK